jgi:hypothetical protein
LQHFPRQDEAMDMILAYLLIGLGFAVASLPFQIVLINSPAWKHVAAFVVNCITWPIQFTLTVVRTFSK